MTRPTLRDELLRLELAIARRDPAAIAGGYAGVLDERFREIGASGRTWSRAEILEVLATAPPADVAIERFAAEDAGDDVVLVTYETGGTRRVRRSSLWVRDPDDGRWRLRIHQATPVPAEVP